MGRKLKGEELRDEEPGETGGDLREAQREGGGGLRLGSGKKMGRTGEGISKIAKIRHPTDTTPLSA